MADYPHVFEYPYSVVEEVPFAMKGKWNSEFFGNDRPIVLEVEPPTTETARRRIAFYERNGFSLCERAYVQPPYRPWEETEGLTLLLMTTAPDFLEEHFDEVRATIYAEVYGVTGD